MMEKYRSEVRRFYETQKALGRLSLNLTYPTVSKLRNECLMLFNEGCDESDLRILKSFMERPLKDKLHESAIRRFDPDKFKALYNFLKKDIKTSEKNVELLAWLIDFHPRPYSKYFFATKRNAEIISHLEALKADVLDTQRVVAVPLHYREIVSYDRYANNSLFGKFKENSGNRNSYAKAGSLADNENILQQKTSSTLKRYMQNRQQMRSSENDNGFNPPYLHVEQGKAENPKELFGESEEVTAANITLEYPTGVKLSVCTSNLHLISQLLRL